MDPRLLVACASCRRQYEVGGMKAGEHIRCRCGVLVTVPSQRPHEARILHCSGCGGKLRDGARRCDYCGGEISAAERNLGPACPECFARLAGGARFCSDCGIEIRPEMVRTVRASARCPRCRGELLLHEVKEGHYTECAACGGIWLDPDSFQRLVDGKHMAARPELGMLGGGASPWAGATHAGALEAVRYIPCPTCGSMMNRKNFASSGVIIDWCKGHGLWFDPHELEKVVSHVRSGGLDRARKLELESLNRRLIEARARKASADTSTISPAAATGSPDWISTVVEGVFEGFFGSFFDF